MAKCVILGSLIETAAMAADRFGSHYANHGGRRRPSLGSGGHLRAPALGPQSATSTSVGCSEPINRLCAIEN